MSLKLSTDHDLYIVEQLKRENKRLRNLNQILKTSTAVMMEWAEHTGEKVNGKWNCTVDENLCPKCYVKDLLNSFDLKFED